jgi:hypothetical protein
MNQYIQTMEMVGVPQLVVRALKACLRPINSVKVHELVQSRIAALEGEKVQGGEDDKRSGQSYKRGMTMR